MDTHYKGRSWHTSFPLGKPRAKDHHPPDPRALLVTLRYSLKGEAGAGTSNYIFVATGIWNSELRVHLVMNTEEMFRYSLHL